MANDFVNIMVIYILLLIMYALIGNLNFNKDCPEYQTLFDTFITLIDSSMGNYDFQIMAQIENEDLKIVGEIYLVVVVVTFAVLILNLVIAILSNTYNKNDPKSKGLYLSKILSTRDELLYDEKYGSFLSSLTPFNIFTLPFVPLVLRNPSVRLNRINMMTQYVLFMLLIFIGFICISTFLIPFAFI
jgi:hypothetical protein